MLTPKDIHEKDFTKGFKGYDMEEVDLFLDEIIEDYDKIIRENRELIARIDSLNTQLETYRGMEDSLMHTMVTAHKAADDINAKAKAEAEKVVSEAETEAERILADAKDDSKRLISQKQALLDDYEDQLFELNDILEEFKSGIAGYSDELMKLVDSFDAPTSFKELEAEIEAEQAEYEAEIEEEIDEETEAEAEEVEAAETEEAEEEFTPMGTGDYQYETVDPQTVNAVDPMEDTIPVMMDDNDNSNFYQQQAGQGVAEPEQKKEDAYYGPVEVDDEY